MTTGTMMPVVDAAGWLKANGFQVDWCNKAGRLFARRSTRDPWDTVSRVDEGRVKTALVSAVIAASLAGCSRA